MIYIEMYGRLGNQFFRYAAARALQKRFYPEEELTININQINTLGKTDSSFYNVLDDYNVIPYIQYKKKGKVLFNESSVKQKIICFFYSMGLNRFPLQRMTEQEIYQKKWAKLLGTNGIYWFRNGFVNTWKSGNKNKFVSGNFEASAFFNDIRDDLLKEFTPKQAPLEKNREMYTKIASTNSVCISIRRGDFESNEKFKELHSVCDETYFAKAIEKAKEIIDNPVFFLFSDDVDWAKENIDTGCKTYCEDGNDPVWEKLRMMSSCKHFILSNSTFSWWAQYLCTNEDKKVISPSKWFNSSFNCPLIEESFIRISV